MNIIKQDGEKKVFITDTGEEIPFDRVKKPEKKIIITDEKSEGKSKEDKK